MGVGNPMGPMGPMGMGWDGTEVRGNGMGLGLDLKSWESHGNRWD